MKKNLYKFPNDTKSFWFFKFIPTEYKLTVREGIPNEQPINFKLRNLCSVWKMKLVQYLAATFLTECKKNWSDLLWSTKKNLFFLFFFSSFWYNQHKKWSWHEIHRERTHKGKRWTENEKEEVVRNTWAGKRNLETPWFCLPIIPSEKPLSSYFCTMCFIGSKW